MFEGLSLTHILVFALILLLFFGARRLPEIGGALGKSIGEFKRSMREIQNDASVTGADLRRPERSAQAGTATGPTAASASAGMRRGDES